MKPTIEEVKERFKDAKEVKSTFGKEFNYSKSLNLHFYSGAYFVSYKNIDYCIWDEWSGFSEIISYKQTLNQLTDKEVRHAYDNPEYLKEMFPKAFETELEVNRWYKNTSNKYCENIIFYNSDEKKCFGFAYMHNDWSNTLYFNKKYNWVLATESEVTEALIKEAKKRGFEENKSLTLKWEKDGITYEDVKGKFRYNNTRNHLSIGNYIIFIRGEWAEIIQPDRYIQIPLSEIKGKSNDELAELVIQIAER